jgi:hypothetical protein
MSTNLIDAYKIHKHKNNINTQTYIFVGRLSLSLIMWLATAFLQKSEALAIILWDTKEIFIYEYHFS